MVLTFISYIGMSVSIVSLITTLIILISFKLVNLLHLKNYDCQLILHDILRKLRQKAISKYHIQLSLSLLFMLIVSFVLVAFSSENVTALYGGCVTVSVLVHYFTLVAVMWMGAEALFTFQKLVIVFIQITTKYIIIVSTICWCT